MFVRASSFLMLVLYLQGEYASPEETLYFRADKKKRIDFVLAYKEVKDEDPKHKARRETFEYNLVHKEKLELEHEPKEVCLQNFRYQSGPILTKILSLRISLILRIFLC